MSKISLNDLSVSSVLSYDIWVGKTVEFKFEEGDYSDRLYSGIIVECNNYGFTVAVENKDFVDITSSDIAYDFVDLFIPVELKYEKEGCWIIYIDDVSERCIKPFASIDYALDWVDKYNYDLVDIVVSIKDKVEI